MVITPTTKSRVVKRGQRVRSSERSDRRCRGPPCCTSSTPMIVLCLVVCMLFVSMLQDNIRNRRKTNMVGTPSLGNPPIPCYRCFLPCIYRIVDDNCHVEQIIIIQTCEYMTPVDDVISPVLWVMAHRILYSQSTRMNVPGYSDIVWVESLIFISNKYSCKPLLLVCTLLDDRLMDTYYRPYPFHRCRSGVIKLHTHITIHSMDLPTGGDNSAHAIRLIMLVLDVEMNDLCDTCSNISIYLQKCAAQDVWSWARCTSGTPGTDQAGSGDRHRYVTPACGYSVSPNANRIVELVCNTFTPTCRYPVPRVSNPPSTSCDNMYHYFELPNVSCVRHQSYTSCRYKNISNGNLFEPVVHLHYVSCRSVCNVICSNSALTYSSDLCTRWGNYHTLEYSYYAPCIGFNDKCSHAMVRLLNRSAPVMIVAIDRHMASYTHMIVYWVPFWICYSVVHAHYIPRNDVCNVDCIYAVLWLPIKHNRPVVNIAFDFSRFITVLTDNRHCRVSCDSDFPGPCLVYRYYTNADALMYYLNHPIMVIASSRSLKAHYDKNTVRSDSVTSKPICLSNTYICPDKSVSHMLSIRLFSSIGGVTYTLRCEYYVDFGPMYLCNTCVYSIPVQLNTSINSITGFRFALLDADMGGAHVETLTNVLYRPRHIEVIRQTVTNADDIIHVSRDEILYGLDGKYNSIRTVLSVSERFCGLFSRKASDVVCDILAPISCDGNILGALIIHCQFIQMDTKIYLITCYEIVCVTLTTPCGYLCLYIEVYFQTISLLVAVIIHRQPIQMDTKIYLIVCYESVCVILTTPCGYICMYTEVYFQTITSNHEKRQHK